MWLKLYQDIEGKILAAGVSSPLSSVGLINLPLFKLHRDTVRILIPVGPP